MLRIDRYTTRSFGVALLATLVVSVTLFVVMDAFPNLDDFSILVRNRGLLAGLGTIGRFYVMHVLRELGTFGEIIVAVAAVVVIAGMARANELVPLLAGGMSLRRLVLPVFVCCGVVGFSIFMLRSFAGPELSRRARDDWRTIKRTSHALGMSLSVQGRSGERGEAAVALSVERYDAATNEGIGFAASVIAPGRPFVDIRADRAVWDHDAAAWRFPEGARRWQYASSENPVAALSTIEELRTDLSPDLLEAEELGPRVLGIGGLVRQRARPEFAAALHERLAQVFAPLALALAALPFLLTTDRTRVVYGTVAATLVVVSYEVLSRALTAMAATGYLPPVVGGWLVPVVFCGFGAWRLAVLDT